MFMRKCLLSFGVFLATACLADAQPPTGRTFAFLVACGDYDKTQLKPVAFTVAEMQQFRSVLVDSGIAAQNIVFLHDKAEETRRFIPTRDNIVKEFRLLLERLRVEDSIIVALSGHGVHFARKSTATSARSMPNWIRSTNCCLWLAKMVCSPCSIRARRAGSS